jgi:hypothetical protein
MIVQKISINIKQQTKQKKNRSLPSMSCFHNQSENDEPLYLVIIIVPSSRFFTSLKDQHPNEYAKRHMNMYSNFPISASDVNHVSKRNTISVFGEDNMSINLFNKYIRFIYFSVYSTLSPDNFAKKILFSNSRSSHLLNVA